MPICKRWSEIAFRAEASNFAVSKTIVIFNLVIRFFIIWIMSYVGAKTETLLAVHITLGIFICVILNTGFLILISDANLKA
jgi:hypothetical protein